MKKLVSLLLVALTLAIISPSKPVSASNMELNKSKAVLEVSATIKLKLSDLKGNAPTWSSSDKTVATVTKWGTVTAKSSGVATITATYNKKDYDCIVNVVDSNTDAITLRKGTYIVGQDIDAGKYDVEPANKEWCRMIVYTNTDKDDYVMSEQIGPEDGGYSNLVLSDGNYIVIKFSGTVELNAK